MTRDRSDDRPSAFAQEDGDDEDGPLEGVLEADGVFRCRALGFGIRVPIGWHPLTADAFSIDALKVAAVERRLVMTKHPEPYEELNPSITLIVRTRPAIGPDSPAGMLRMAMAAMPHMLREFVVEEEPSELTLGGRPGAKARFRYDRDVVPGKTYRIRSAMATVFHGDLVYQLSYAATLEGPDAYDEAMELFFATLELETGDEPTRYPLPMLVANGFFQFYATAPIRSRHQLEASLGVALAQAGLARLSTKLAPLATPCFRMLRTRSSDAEIPIGASKIGGFPDLPEWTTWPDRDGEPIPFLAQIHLSAIRERFPDCPLPPDGLLSVFCDPEALALDDPDSCRIVYSAAGTSELRRRHPKDRENYAPPYPAAALDLFEAPSLPSPGSACLLPLGLNDQEAETYATFYLGLMGSPEDPFHQVLGYPTQTSPADDTPGSDSVLLLQLGADPEIGLLWNAGSILGFWVRHADLEARRFDTPQATIHGEPSLDEEPEPD